MNYDCKDTAGVVGKPQTATSKSSPKPMSVSYTSGMGSTSSGPNLSAKFKSPNVSQSIPEKGRGQYE